MQEDQAKRDNKGKSKMHYLGYFYLGLQKVCDVCEFGEKKYSKGNFMKGKNKPASEYFDAALRHILKGVSTNRDSESKEYHAAHATWNLLEYMSRAESETLIDDMKEEVPQARVDAAEGILRIGDLECDMCGKEILYGCHDCESDPESIKDEILKDWTSRAKGEE
jgi:hypothetical protein